MATGTVLPLDEQQISSRAFNQAAWLLWTHKGGDIVDAAGQAAPLTGASNAPPLATLRPEGSGVFSGNVAPLLRRLKASGNSSLVCVARGDGGFFGRHSEHPPTLVADGASLRCTAANIVHPTNESPADPRAILGGGWPIALGFDLAQASPDVQNAILRLTLNDHIVTSLDVYELAAPPLADLSAAPTTKSRYDGRTLEQLAADATCVVAGDCWPDTLKRLGFEGQTGGLVGLGFDATLGRRATYEYTPQNRSPIAMTRRHTTLRKPQLNEAWLVYPMRFPDKGTYVQGSKVGMGISGRGGQSVDGALRVMCGNGDGRPDGRYHPEWKPPGTCGFSLRMIAGPTIMGGPADGKRPFSLYLYSPLQATEFGDMLVARGVLVGPGDTPTIKLYMKRNTVSNPDPQGNGTGNRNGVIRLFFNEREVRLQDLDTLALVPPDQFLFVNNEKMGLDELPWIDTYEGGREEPRLFWRIELGWFIVSTLDPGMPKLALTRPATIPNVTHPVGNFDLIDANGRCAGWAADEDQDSNALHVRIKIDGVVANEIACTDARPDVLKALPWVRGTPGWHYQLPPRLDDGREHRIEAHALDNDGAEVALATGVRAYRKAAGPAR